MELGVGIDAGRSRPKLSCVLRRCRKDSRGDMDAATVLDDCSVVLGEGELSEEPNSAESICRDVDRGFVVGTHGLYRVCTYARM